VVTIGAPSTRKSWLRRWWHLCAKTLRGVTRLEDTPYRIAMGAACGLHTAVWPILGQTLIGMLAARLLRANVFAAIPWSWITNPLTTLPIWYGCYRVGAAVTWREPVTIERIQSLITAVDTKGFIATLQDGGSLLLTIIGPLWLGSLLVGTALAAVGYIAIQALVKSVQTRRLAVHKRWSSTS
jgi:uncharacterized protein (DUF2062 family)